MVVRSKRENYALYHSGALGNKVRTWNTYQEMVDSGFTGTYAIRYRVPASPWCRYDLTLEQGPSVMAEFIKQGADPKLFEFSEMGPEKHLVIQGEVQRHIDYYDFFYSTYEAPMRIALKKGGTTARGIVALRLMKDSMDAPSWDNLQRLFDLYPDSVIEFTVYSKAFGSLGWNTIFWEVRNY